MLDEEVTDIIKDAINENLRTIQYQAMQQELHDEIEPICRNVVAAEVDMRCRGIVIDEINHHYQFENQNQNMRSPPSRKSNHDHHTRSAKQLPHRFANIHEVVEEDSPDPLPMHNMPPTSYVDARSSVLNSEANHDTYSADENYFKFTSDQQRPLSRGPGGDKIDLLRETKNDRLKDYLRDKFIPPSETGSQGRLSSRSIRSSRHVSPEYFSNKKHAISFGVHDTKEENSLGTFRHSPSPNRSSRDQNSFLRPNSRARQVMINDDQPALIQTDLKNRISFGDTSVNEEFKINSTPMLNDSDDLVEDHRFGFARKTPQMKSQKYTDNLRFSQNQYYDVQDVIRENKKNHKDAL